GAGAVGADAVMLVLSRRTGEVASSHTAEVLDALAHDAHPIVLRRFDIHETRAYLHAQGTANLDADLALAVLRFTGGNPLFLRRVVSPGGEDLVRGGLS